MTAEAPGASGPDVSGLYDDNVRHNLIPMLVLSRKMAGAPLPEDVEADAMRFAGGDDGVDVQDLCRRLEPYLAGNAPSVDFGSITFTSGQMAEGPDFSVPVPDGWVLATKPGELRNGDHPFEIRSTELTPEESVSTDVDELRYVVTPSSGPDAEALFAEVGIPELRRAALFQGMAVLARKGQGLVWFGTIYDEQSKRATCLVLQTEAQDPGHLAFQIYPLYATGSDCLFCDLRVAGDDDGDACREFVQRLARGIKMRNDPRPAAERRLDAPWAGHAKEVIADFTRLANSYAKSWENLLDDDTLAAIVGDGASEYAVFDFKCRMLPLKLTMSDATMPAFDGYLGKLEEAIKDGMDGEDAATLLKLIVQAADACSPNDARDSDDIDLKIFAPALSGLWDEDSRMAGVFAHATLLEEELGVPGTVEEIVADPWKLGPAKKRAKEMAEEQPATKKWVAKTDLADSVADAGKEEPAENAEAAKKAANTEKSTAAEQASTAKEMAEPDNLAARKLTDEPSSQTAEPPEMSGTDERSGLLALLRLNVDARAQEGNPCPEELVQELARAEAGDASVDVGQLAVRLAGRGNRRAAKLRRTHARAVWMRAEPPEVLAARARLAECKRALADLPGAPDQSIVDELDARAHNLERELADAGIFQGGKKKELRRQIHEMRERLDSARCLRLQRLSAEHDVDAAREELRQALHDAGIERLFRRKDA